MFPDHKWARDMRSFLININKEKQDLIEQKIKSFSDEKIKQIFEEYDKNIQNGYKENNTVDLTYILNVNVNIKCHKNVIFKMSQFLRYTIC